VDVERGVHVSTLCAEPRRTDSVLSCRREQKLTEFKELLKMHHEMGGDASPPSPAFVQVFQRVFSPPAAAAAAAATPATRRGGGETYRRGTAMQKLRIVILGFGTARQEMVLE
jgi:hypothetical protein